jgi:hypothetical protein
MRVADITIHVVNKLVGKTVGETTCNGICDSEGESLLQAVDEEGVKVGATVAIDVTREAVGEVPRKTGELRSRGAGWRVSKLQSWGCRADGGAFGVERRGADISEV